MRIIRFDSIPEVMESNAFLLSIKKKSIKANIKKQIQIGKIAFFINPGDTA